MMKDYVLAFEGGQARVVKAFGPADAAERVYAEDKTGELPEVVSITLMDAHAKLTETLARLREALAGYDEIDARKREFIGENMSEDLDEPACGYAEWDETIADFNYELVDAGDDIVRVVREVLAELDDDEEE